ncbi:39132_t:CDS:1, partial [Gigaspora margarita]
KTVKEYKEQVATNELTIRKLQEKINKLNRTISSLKNKNKKLEDENKAFKEGHVDNYYMGRYHESQLEIRSLNQKVNFS